MNSIGLTLGAMTGFGLWALIALISITFIIGGIIFHLRDRQYSDGLLYAGFAAVTLAVFSLGMALVFIPWNSSYWQLWQTKGTITSISNVVTEASGDLTRQPVVTLDTVDRPVIVDDPRIVDYKGQKVTLNCVKQWHFRAADTYTCKINSIPEARP